MYLLILAKRLYIPLQVQANSGTHDGACALVVGFLHQPPVAKAKTEKSNNLILKKAVLESAIGPDSIIAARGPNAKVSLFDIQLMKTSTTLPYLIIQGGVIDPDKAQRKVFALPVVNESTSQYLGMIANKNQNPQENKSAFLQKIFVHPARTPQEMPTSSDVSAMVGGGDAPAPISTLIVHADTVFVSTVESGEGQKPGIFSSQALFDESGKISGWTSWQRGAGMSSSVTGFAFDLETTKFWIMTDNETFDNELSIRTVLRTRFNPEAHGHSLAHLSKELFENYEGGIQQVDAFGPSTRGIFSKSS